MLKNLLLKSLQCSEESRRLSRRCAGGRRREDFVCSYGEDEEAHFGEITGVCITVKYSYIIGRSTSGYSVGHTALSDLQRRRMQNLESGFSLELRAKIYSSPTSFLIFKVLITLLWIRDTLETVNPHEDPSPPLMHSCCLLTLYFKSLPCITVSEQRGCI